MKYSTVRYRCRYYMCTCSFSQQLLHVVVDYMYRNGTCTGMYQINIHFQFWYFPLRYLKLLVYYSCKTGSPQGQILFPGFRKQNTCVTINEQAGVTQLPHWYFQTGPQHSPSSCSNINFQQKRFIFIHSKQKLLFLYMY